MMRHWQQKLGAMMVVMVLAYASSAHAAVDTPMVVADASAAHAPRFISLAPVRAGTAGLPTATRPTLRSDRAALQSGFMRIDRTNVQRVRIQRAMPATIAALPRHGGITRPQDDAVLDLFGDSTSATPALSPAPRSGRTAHAWPLPGNVTQKLTSGFGPRRDPFHGKQAFHGGIDIAAAPGTRVLASADGVVSKVETGARYGKYVSVRHRDGTESSYGHLRAQSVRVGQQVRQGQQLGELGSTGRSTGPHLDYRISKQGDLFNPMSVLHQPTASPSRVASRGGVRVIR